VQDGYCRAWTQQSPGVPGASESGDQFGSSLASGYFGENVGVPGEDHGAGQLLRNLDNSPAEYKPPGRHAGAAFGTSVT
jgi:hypothetical protein